MDRSHVPLLLLVGLCLMSVGADGQTNTTMAPTNATSANAPSKATAPMNASHSPSMSPDVTPPMNASHSPSMSPKVTPPMNASHSPSMSPKVTPPMNASHSPSMSPKVSAPMNASHSPSMSPKVTPPMNASHSPSMSPKVTPPMNASHSPSMSPKVTPPMNASHSPSMSPNATRPTDSKPSANASKPTATTAVSDIVANTTVETLSGNITRALCGRLKVCVSQPEDCDPSTTESGCTFVSLRRVKNRDFEAELSAETEGFLALTLTPPDGVNATRYMCAKDEGEVRMFTAIIVNGEPIIQQLPVNRVRGRINRNKIDCTFFVRPPVSTSRNTDNTFAVSVGTGLYNATSNTFGTPSTIIRTNEIDIANASQNVTNIANTTATTTAAPTTTAVNGAPLQQPMFNGVLLGFGILGLFWFRD